MLRTRDLNANILRGVTRKSLMELIAREGLQVSERPFSVEEAKQAREAFITGAGSLVTPVVTIDGAALGDGLLGPVALRLRASYLSEASDRAA